MPLPPVTPADLLLINDCIAQNPRFQIQKYRMTAYHAPTCLEMERMLVCTSVRIVQRDVDPCMCLSLMLFGYSPPLLACLSTFVGLLPR